MTTTNPAADNAILASALLQLFDLNTWIGQNAQQQDLITWLTDHKEQVLGLPGLVAKASTDTLELNSWLVEENLAAKRAQRLNPYQFALIAFSHFKLVWSRKAEAGPIHSHDSALYYRGLSLGPDDVQFYRLTGYRSPLARISTVQGYDLWVMMSDFVPRSRLELIKFATRIANEPRTINERLTEGIRLPQIRVSQFPNMDWLVGLKALGHLERQYELAQAFQSIQISWDTSGPGNVSKVGLDPFQFTGRFCGFLTHGHVPLPIAPFFAAPNCWVPLAGRKS